jgi:hypothetical protein
VCEGGRTGASVQSSAKHVKNKCGVYIGHWRPNSNLNPEQRTRVAIKVMEKGKKNADIQHLVRMDFPYVNHFLGEFDSSQQLGVAPGSALTIMVSSHCPGGDHWSALYAPKSDPDAYVMHLQSHADGRFCFVNPDHPLLCVNHAMAGPARVTLNFKCLEAFSYICVCSDPNISAAGTICRVEKIDEHFFTLWSSQCAHCFPSPPASALAINSSQFNVPFHLNSAQNARCFMLYAQLEAAPVHDPHTSILKFFKCMPRPNVAFLRAFSVQLLRALGYCHSRKLTAHNGKLTRACESDNSALIFFCPCTDLRTVNIFHKEPLTAHHLLCSVPPYCADYSDPHAMLRAIRMELGDFGLASPLNVDALNHQDFRYAAMVLYVAVVCARPLKLFPHARILSQPLHSQLLVFPRVA